MNNTYNEIIKNRFLNVVFSLRKSPFLDRFNIDDSLGGENYPGYILTHENKNMSLVICVKKINTESLLEGSEGYIVSITQKENEDIICTKSMWFYSSSLIGNKFINGGDDTFYENDMISIMRTTMEALKNKFNTKTIINNKDNEEYAKYEQMFDMCEKLNKIY